MARFATSTPADRTHVDGLFVGGLSRVRNPRALPQHRHVSKPPFLSLGLSSPRHGGDGSGETALALTGKDWVHVAFPPRILQYGGAFTYRGTHISTPQMKARLVH
ncbi:hypothetical protein [Nitrosovibrio sp. Nv4]|uniref:hypothetical protein n=1 Tax=Nitrosovibrio sp. Nv4 TaxID=1945880 RepID=UPI00117EBDED|nr:hypothetical protein [Nitrosovibrio sp. Nv4]